MYIGIVGATGAVGQELMPLLEQRHIPVSELRIFASEKSAGKKLQTPFGEKTLQVLNQEGIRGLDAIFFAASGEISAEWCPKASEQGIVCIDKSSYFRMNPAIPLVVPEVNAESIGEHNLIANPNCTTSIAAVVLWPIHRELGLRRVIISTYQAASGAGNPAMNELKDATRARLDGTSFVPKEFRHDLAFNLIPHIDSFQENGYTKEEMKVTDELRKIMQTPELPIECTAVRVPILRAHSESITIETEKKFVPAAIQEILDRSPGIELRDNPDACEYPMPMGVEGKNNVQVGRIRSSLAFGEHGGTFFVVGDQLLKGAALNAIQILEYVIRKRGIRGE